MGIFLLLPWMRLAPRRQDDEPLHDLDGLVLVEVLEMTLATHMVAAVAAAGVADDAQLLVNLGMVHNDGEWMPYWESWIAWMREQGWRRFGWYVWDQGPGLPGNWSGRLAPSHEFVFHFNRVSRQANKTVESKHAGEALTGGGLRSVDGVVPKKSHAVRAIQTHRVPDSVFRIMRHKGGLGAAG